MARSLVRGSSIVVAAVALGRRFRGRRARRPARIADRSSRSATSRKRARPPASAPSPAVSSAACSGTRSAAGPANTVATIAGAAGGAYVGNTVEKNRNTKGYWQVTIKMDGGTTRTFRYTNQPSVHEGERVKLVDGGKRLALVAN